MKKRIVSRAFILFVFLLFLSGCIETETTPEETGALSELQVTACNTAHDEGTCNTRLSEVGIVTKEDCCKILGKCC